MASIAQVKAAALARIDSILSRWCPGGKQQGREYLPLNPRRADSKPGSFSINLDTGAWADFADDAKGGDLVSLVAYIEGVGQGEAARLLAQFLGMDSGKTGSQKRATSPQSKAGNTQVSPISKQTEWVAVLPVPVNAPKPPARHYRYGVPSMQWAYRDAAGELLCLVYRFERGQASDRKQFVPLTWCRNTQGKQEWRWQGLDSPRPLYNLPGLVGKPDALVIVCEGEKAADAAAVLFPAAVTTTMLNGAQAPGKTDWSPLAGRKVWLWRDNDEAGLKCMQAVDGLLRQARAARVQHINLAAIEGLQDKDDAADLVARGWTAERMAGLAGGDGFLLDSPAPASSPAATTSAAAPMQDDPLDTPISRFHVNDQKIQNSGVTGVTNKIPCADERPTYRVFDDGLEHEKDRQYPSRNIPVPSGEFPDINGNGKPLNTIENVEFVLNWYSISIKYSVITKDRDIYIPGQISTTDNAQKSANAEILSLLARNHVPKVDLDAYLWRIADSNMYNPVTDWINSIPWDGNSRLQQLFDTVTVRGDSALRDLLMRRWMISAVAAAATPEGFSSKGVLVFSGPQSVGKTTWFRNLLPPEMRRVSKEGAILDPSNKDSVLGVISHWLVELGELDGTLRGSDIAQLKAFITQTTDKIRVPYGRREDIYQRRTVFFASVNDDQYLADPSGSSRFWTLNVTSINYMHNINMQQLWAEVYSLFRANERWWLDSYEEILLSQSNQDHQAPEPWTEPIANYCLGKNQISIQDVLSHALDISANHQDSRASRRISKILIDMGYVKRRHRGPAGIRLYSYFKDSEG